MRTVKCDCLVLSLGRRFTIYCLDSSPQFCRICLVIQRLHKLSLLLSSVFVRYSGNRIVHLWQGGQGRASGSEIISCSHLFQYLCWNRLCVDSVSSVVWCDAALRIMARKIFSPFWQSVGSCLLLSLSLISLLYRSQFAFFRLMLVRCCIGVIVMSICKLMRIGRWSEPRFVFVCQLVEVIREADANETGELGLALPGNLVRESQFMIPKLAPDTMVSNIVPLESVELEYHDEW